METWGFDLCTGDVIEDCRLKASRCARACRRLPLASTHPSRRPTMCGIVRRPEEDRSACRRGEPASVGRSGLDRFHEEAGEIDAYFDAADRRG